MTWRLLDEDPALIEAINAKERSPTPSLGGGPAGHGVASARPPPELVSQSGHQLAFCRWSPASQRMVLMTRSMAGRTTLVAQKPDQRAA